MSSVFGKGQSTNSMVRIMKANQLSKVCASSHEYPHVETIKNLHEQNFKGTVAQPNVTNVINLRATRKELTSGQKEKPHSKKNNLTAKRKRLMANEKRIKNVLSGSKKSCCESFSFCLEVFLFAMRF